MLNYRVYYENRYWWFELVETNPHKSGITPIDILFRRRYRTGGEARRCAREALDHTRRLRAERILAQQAADEA